MFDPSSAAHRAALAAALRERLTAAGFHRTAERTRDPGRVYSSGFTGREEVYDLTHRKDPGLTVRVFSSIVGEGVRGRGADAIRVALVYRNLDKRRDPDAEGGRVYTLEDETRVFRVGTIEAIVDRVIERCREAYQAANLVERCRCGAVIATSRQNKRFCAETCWLKNHRRYDPADVEG